MFSGVDAQGLHLIDRSDDPDCITQQTDLKNLSQGRVKTASGVSVL